jgi:hypothetical protein
MTCGQAAPSKRVARVFERPIAWRPAECSFIVRERPLLSVPNVCSETVERLYLVKTGRFAEPLNDRFLTVRQNLPVSNPPGTIERANVNALRHVPGTQMWNVIEYGGYQSI